MPESYRIVGGIRDEENKPVAGFTVQAFDKETGIHLRPDPRLGKAVSGQDGRFEIYFRKETFKGWFENDPKVYLVVRDRAGKVVLQTGERLNTTGQIEFQVKLGEREVDPVDPNIYGDGLSRIVASFRGMGGVLDFSRTDVREVSEILLRAVDSWTLYRDSLFRLSGYDGIQVPAQPRKEQHLHVTRWDRPVLP